MRLVLSIACLFSSLSSMAWIDLELVSQDYRIKARMSGDQGAMMMGSIVAQTQSHGSCQGRFVLDPMAGMLSVSFDGNNGPGSAGGCAKESMTADIGPSGFGQLIGGAQITAVMRSQMFDDQPRDAMVRMTGMGEN